MTICLALEVSLVTWKLSPTSGRLSSPITSTGIDGSASRTGLPRSSNIARTLLNKAPQMKKSPTLSVPLRTNMVATGPRPLSSFASSTLPMAGRAGFAFKSCRSATIRIISSKRSRFCLALADTGTMTTSPPQSSASKPRSANCCFTRSGVASGLSILLMATMMGTLAARAWSIASKVWGMTPSSAETTSTTMSVILAPRERIRVNA